MRDVSLPLFAGIFLGVSIMMAGFGRADALKDEIAPTGKLRVAIGTSAAGGAYWSTKTENGYAGVPVDLGKALADQLGVPVEYVAYPNSGEITDAASKGAWDVSFLPKDPERETKMLFGPIYEVADATYIVKPGSAIKDFATLDQVGVKVAAVNNTTTMRGAEAHLKEELGDLLLQIVFHARLADEEGQFDLADVARGVQRREVVEAMNARLLEFLPISAILVCYEDGDDCPRRKPNPGLLLDAAETYGIDLPASFMRAYAARPEAVSGPTPERPWNFMPLVNAIDIGDFLASSGSGPAGLAFATGRDLSERSPRAAI